MAGKIVKCKECGKPFRRTQNNRVFCKDCNKISKEIPLPPVSYIQAIDYTKQYSLSPKLLKNPKFINS